MIKPLDQQDSEFQFDFQEFSSKKFRVCWWFVLVDALINFLMALSESIFGKRNLFYVDGLRTGYVPVGVSIILFISLAYLRRRQNHILMISMMILVQIHWFWNIYIDSILYVEIAQNTNSKVQCQEVLEITRFMLNFFSRLVYLLFLMILVSLFIQNQKLVRVYTASFNTFIILSIYLTFVPTESSRSKSQIQSACMVFAIGGYMSTYFLV